MFEMLVHTTYIQYGPPSYTTIARSQVPSDDLITLEPITLKVKIENFKAKY